MFSNVQVELMKTRVLAWDRVLAVRSVNDDVRVFDDVTLGTAQYCYSSQGCYSTVTVVSAVTALLQHCPSEVTD